MFSSGFNFLLMLSGGGRGEGVKVFWGVKLDVTKEIWGWDGGGCTESQ